MKKFLKITADEHRLTPMVDQCHPETLEGRTKSKKRSLSILFITLFLSSCSDPFPKGRLFDIIALQKILPVNINTISTSGDTTTTPTVSSNKYIFLTVGTYNGNLGGIAGADTKCQTEKTANFASLPGAATEYKAFLVDGTTRVACTSSDCGGGIGENDDWVLKANTDYYRLDGATDTKIFTTNASGIVDFNGGATLLTAIDSSGTTFWWTGMYTTWVFDSACSNWVTTVAVLGNRGTGGVTTSLSTNLYSTCSTGLKLLCVRQ